MKPLYITPRLAIANITSYQDIPTLSSLVESRHKHHHHYFNLTIYKIGQQKQSSFKWRGIPFSLTETIKIVTQIDTFLRMNQANTAIICTSHPHLHQFARFISKTYLKICILSVKTSKINSKMDKISKLTETIFESHPYLTQQILQIYQNITINAPPLKILESLSIQPSHLFIPIFEISNESRFNDFQPIYLHQIQEQLGDYYINHNRPLETGIGKRFFDQKPQTDYFKKPVLVFGDVKITVYSYKHLKKVQEFTIGFNTYNINTLNSQNQGFILLSSADFYDKNRQSETPKLIKIGYSEYCDNSKCTNSAQCSDCKQNIKRLSNRYSETQSDLQKLNRTRTASQVSFLLSL